jgi:RNA polymerase sigma-70 factor, ECF subfamily
VSVPEASDRRLIRDLRAGKRAACAELVRAHYAGIYRLLLHLTRDVPLAEDLTQETFATAWQRIADFEGRSALATWLHRIAFGKFVDACRSSRRHTALVEHLKGEAADSRSAAPPEAAETGDETRLLYAALERLEDNDRVPLVLHYLQGLSYREMAEVLDEPAGTVKWRVSQALERLRALLAPEVKQS